MKLKKIRQRFLFNSLKQPPPFKLIRKDIRLYIRLIKNRPLFSLAIHIENEVSQKEYNVFQKKITHFVQEILSNPRNHNPTYKKKLLRFLP